MTGSLPDPNTAALPSTSASSPPTSQPTKCACDSHHFGQVILDRQLPVDIEKVYELLNQSGVDKSELFLERYLQSRGTTDLVIDDNWNELDGAAQEELKKSCKDLGTYQNLESLFSLRNVKLRSMTFTLLINHVLCKSVFAREKTYLMQNEPGRCFVVYSQAKNEGPPYSDCFIVNSCWCVTSLGEGKGTRIVVHFKLSWIKSGFSVNLMKNTIEKSSKEGFAESTMAKVKRLEMELGLIEPDDNFIAGSQSGGAAKKSVEVTDEEVNETVTSAVEASPASPERKSRTNSVRAETQSAPSSVHITQTGLHRMELNFLKIILVAMTLLVIVNIVLFFRLYRIEHQVQELAKATYQFVEMTNRRSATSCDGRTECQLIKDEF